jgi:hypothetical protein
VTDPRPPPGERAPGIVRPPPAHPDSPRPLRTIPTTNAHA